MARAAGDVVARRRLSQAKKIGSLIAKIEKQMKNTDFKATVADYIRLLQMHKEFDKDVPRDIEVTWVETPNEKESNAA